MYTMCMKNKYFIGIDIGGTKISAALADTTGTILIREKIATPRNAGAKEILFLLVKLIAATSANITTLGGSLCGIGIGIPGIIKPRAHTIIAAPNISLAGLDITGIIAKKFNAPVYIGNDVNLGLLGEHCFGCAKSFQSVLGVFPGTGVGGAAIIDGHLFVGTHGAATEFGHIIIDPKGPLCSCGNTGCLEAHAGRWAIERDIRKAIASGTKTIITKLLNKKNAPIKSKVIKEALEHADPLVTTIIKKASQAIGIACISLRHAFDPQAIIFGGGLIEACGNYMLPIVKKTIHADPFFKKVGSCKIVASQLADDAVLLGAIALAMQETGAVSSESSLPSVLTGANNSLYVNGIHMKHPFYIRANGKLKKIPTARPAPGIITQSLLKNVCKKNPDIIFIAKKNIPLSLTPSARALIHEKNIRISILPASHACQRYAVFSGKKAFLAP